jgi:sugar phosphate isomerase/epimerase
VKLGLFSVSYAGLWGQDALTTDEFLRRAKDLGFAGVLLMAKSPHVSPARVTDGELERIADTLEETGLALIGLAGYNDFLLAGPAEVPVLEMQLHYIQACARITQKLGGTTVRVFTGYPVAEGNSTRDRALVVAALREAGDRARDHGVTLAVQNHHPVAVETKEMHRLLTELDHPNVKAGFDAWNLFLRGEDLYDAAKRMTGLTQLTIAADYVTVPRYEYHPALVNYSRIYPDLVRAVAMGEGGVDYPSFFRGLHDGGYDSWAVYEMCSPVDGGPTAANLDAKARAFVDYMRPYV